MENEDAFAAEARDEVLRITSQEAQDVPIHHTTGHAVRQDGLDNEEAPLLSRVSSTEQSLRSGIPSKDYETTINQPWTCVEGLPWYKRPSVFWLLPGFLPYCLAFGGLFVPRTYLILDLLCQEYLSDRAAKDPTFNFMPVMFGAENPQCRDAHVQALAARFQLYTSLLSGIFSAIVSPYMGALSDRVGRRKIIAFTTVGMFLQEVVTIIVGSHPGEISVYWLLSGFLMDGLCGSFTTSMSVSFAYASDCTPPERRNVAFGYFHGTLFTGIALGPILSGYLIKWSGGIIVVFYLALCCHLFFILFVLFVIPESVSPERQMHAKEKHRVKMQGPEYETWWKTLKNYNIFEPLSILWPKGAGSSIALRRNIVLLASIDTIMFGVAMGTIQIILIYAEYMFGWNAVDSSIFVSIANICRVTILLVILPLVTRLVRGPASSAPRERHGADMFDINLIRAAILFDLLGYIGYATVKTGDLMIISGVIASFGGIGSPTLASALTRHIPPDRTGQVLGAMGLLHALARVVAPTLFNFIYSVTVGKFTQTVFVCLGSVFLLALVLSLFLKPHIAMDASTESDADDHQETEVTTL